MLTIVDESSRFPFAFNCPNNKSDDQMFILCGTPSYVHPDCRSSLLSQEIKDYFSQRGIARVGLARGEGGVPPQAPCLIKFIRIDIDLYIR